MYWDYSRNFFGDAQQELAEESQQNFLVDSDIYEKIPAIFLEQYQPEFIKKLILNSHRNYWEHSKEISVVIFIEIPVGLLAGIYR